jgi:hypothetical protein
MVNVCPPDTGALRGLSSAGAAQTCSGSANSRHAAAQVGTLRRCADPVLRTCRQLWARPHARICVVPRACTSCPAAVALPAPGPSVWQAAVCGALRRIPLCSIASPPSPWRTTAMPCAGAALRCSPFASVVPPPHRAWHRAQAVPGAKVQRMGTAPCGPSSAARRLATAAPMPGIAKCLRASEPASSTQPAASRLCAHGVPCGRILPSGPAPKTSNPVVVGCSNGATSLLPLKKDHFASLQLGSRGRK